MTQIMQKYWNMTERCFLLPRCVMTAFVVKNKQRHSAVQSIQYRIDQPRKVTTACDQKPKKLRIHRVRICFHEFFCNKVLWTDEINMNLRVKENQRCARSTAEEELHQSARQRSRLFRLLSQSPNLTEHA